MERRTTLRRHDFEKRIETSGFPYHHNYWHEGVYYTFTPHEVEALYEATTELYQCFIDTLDYVIQNNLLSDLGIPLFYHDAICKSWNDDEPSIYGRFDLCYHNGQIKCYEFNADTPTALIEAAVLQWHWLQDMFPNAQQFNTIHEELIDSWKHICKYHDTSLVHFTAISDEVEDYYTTMYLADTLLQAQKKCKYLDLSQIGINEQAKYFLDMDEENIALLFKLYPYEQMAQDEFGSEVISSNTKLIEPLWKFAMQSKALMVYAYRLFPSCRYLIPTYFKNPYYKDFVEKPIFSREGANIKIVKQTDILQTDGEYAQEIKVFQQYTPLPKFHQHYPLIGSWVVGGTSCGIGIREADTLITTGQSKFVPHLFE
jgi:glutathionylspermidine synthase